MSLIHCTSNCLYQQDGYCSLEKASQVSNSSNQEGCLHFIGQNEPNSKVDKRPTKNSRLNNHGFS